jgi:hypothetical protein
MRAGKRVSSMFLAAAVAAAAAPAAACACARAELALPFTETSPARPTGLTMDLRYLDAQDPAAKPPTISELALHLPAGTRIDTAAVPRCEAADVQIQSLGRDACPPESLVGTGRLDVHLGAPGDPQTTDLALFNAPGEIIEVLFFEGTDVTAAIEHLRIEGSVIRARPVQVPPGAPPDRRFAASRIVWDIPARGGYLVTPPACPPDRIWRVRGEFAFADGSTASAAAAQACVPARSGRALHVTASPRRLAAGRPARLAVRVRGGTQACRSGATVRVRGHRLRTDGRGRAAVRLRARRAGALTIRVRTRGCGGARTTIPVVRAGGQRGPRAPSSATAMPSRMRSSP